MQNLMEIMEILLKSVEKLVKSQSVIKNLNNNPGNYCKSLFFKTAQQM